MHCLCVLGLLCVGQIANESSEISARPSDNIANVLWNASAQQTAEWSRSHVVRTTYLALCQATHQHNVRQRGEKQVFGPFGDEVIAPFIYVQRDYGGFIFSFILPGTATYYLWSPIGDIPIMRRDCSISCR